MEPLLSGQQKDIKRIAEMGELDDDSSEDDDRAIDAEQTLLELQTRRMEAIITIREILGPDLDGPRVRRRSVSAKTISTTRTWKQCV